MEEQEKHTFTCFSLKKQEIALIVFLVNAISVSICLLFGGDLRMSIYTAFSLTVISMYLLVLVEVLQKIKIEQHHYDKDEKKILKGLRGEFHHIHKVKKKSEMLKKTTTLDTPPDRPVNVVHKVRMDYLKKLMSGVHHEDSS